MKCKHFQTHLWLVGLIIELGLGYSLAQTETEKPDKTWLSVQYEESNATVTESDKRNSSNTSETKLEQLNNAGNTSMNDSAESVNKTKHQSQQAINPTNLPIPLNPTTKDVRFKGPTGPRITTPKPSVVVSDEDKKVRKDWGGNCTTYHWEICSNQTYFGKDVYDPQTKQKIASQLNCEDPDQFPPVCLFNGWTVTRCHLLCMTKECNKDIKIHYDKYVSKDGFC